MRCETPDRIIFPPRGIPQWIPFKGVMSLPQSSQKKDDTLEKIERR